MAETPTNPVDDRIANMEGEIALPRANGELLFDAPWEARAFGLAVALNEAGLYPWGDFSRGLALQIAGDEASANPTTYYEHWLATLEQLVITNGLITPAEIEAMIEVQALLDDNDHDHEGDDHDHHHHHHHDLHEGDSHEDDAHEHEGH